jgi:hypothetical protein
MYQHAITTKVGTMESNNRLSVSFHRHTMEAFALHKMTSDSLNMSTGVIFPGGHSYAVGTTSEMKTFFCYLFCLHKYQRYGQFSLKTNARIMFCRLNRLGDHLLFAAFLKLQK